jgi:hypothetical protein
MAAPNIIPACLMPYADAPAWVCWTYMGKERRKVPMSPRTGKAGSSTDPRSWGTLAEARKLANARAYRHPYGGIGIVSAAVPSLCFLDLDRCIDPDGVLSPGAARLLEMCGAAYAERTPSGAGLRIIGTVVTVGAGVSRKGTTPDGLAVEIYCGAARYLTVSGLRLADHPDALADISGEVVDLLRLLPGGNNPPAEAAGDERDDAELVRRIATGEGFHAELCAMAARCIGRGMSAAATVGLLRGLMLAQPQPARDERWRERFESIPDLVRSGADKFAAPQEHRRRLARIAGRRLRCGDDPAEVLAAVLAEGRTLGVPEDAAGRVVAWVAAREVERRERRHG